MQMIYDSPHYCVVEFAGGRADGPAVAGPVVRGGHAFLGGYEIVDKLNRREIFLDGPMAQKFREQVSAWIEREPTVEDVDDFLGGFGALMQQPVVAH